MCDANARPDASAATPQPEAQITTSDLIKCFQLEVSGLPRKAVDELYADPASLLMGSSPSC